MYQLKLFWNKVKAPLQFVWRYLFVLTLSVLLLKDFFYYSFDLEGVLALYFWAAFFDWIKYLAQTSAKHERARRRFGVTPSLQSRNPGNYHMVGTSTNLSGIKHRI